MKKTIGDKIREIRYKNKMKQVEFAAAVGIARAYLSQIESNTKQPGRDLIIRISREFDIPINWILTDQETSNIISTKDEREILLLQAFRQLPEDEAQMHFELILRRVKNKDKIN